MANEVMIFDDLDAAGRDAGDALAREAQPWLFDRLDWFRLAQEFTPDGNPLVVRIRNDVARCWLFLSVKGRYASALSNWYCLRYGPVIDGPAGCKAPLGDIAYGLRRAGVSQIYLALVGEDDPLAAELRRKGWMTRRSQVNVSWRIDTKGLSFEEYWAARPSKLRNTANRRARKAQLDLVIHDRFDEKAWADYESVYDASWKPAEGSPQLMRRLAEQEGQAGTLRLGLAYLDGKPLAAQMWVVENGVAIIHKLAYREDARDLSPGTVLSMEMFRRALDIDKAEMIDFGIGDHAYKAEWMSHKVPLYALTAYDMCRLAGLAGIARSLWLKALQHVLRREPPRPAWAADA